MNSKNSQKNINKQLRRAMFKTFCIISILSITACVNFPQAAPPIDNRQPIVLIDQREIMIAKPAEIVFIPGSIPGVKVWYILSDVALERIHKLRIDNERGIGLPENTLK